LHPFKSVTYNKEKGFHHKPLAASKYDSKSQDKGSPTLEYQKFLKNSDPEGYLKRNNKKYGLKRGQEEGFGL
jgi:hypothetical protein